MKLAAIPSETRVNPYARARFFSGGKDAVLIIHGFTGKTSEMVFLATHLNTAGFTVAVPRLPGHGTNGKDFLQSNRHQWLRHVTDTYLDLRAEYERVYVVGLSMGGVLAALIAAQLKPDGIALCAPAILVSRRDMFLTPILAPCIARWKIPYEPDSEDPVERELQQEYYGFQWIRPAAQLYKLMKESRRRLRDITCPTLTIVSTEDTVVPTAVAAFIEKRVASRHTHHVELTQSDHVLVDGVERERVASEIRRWFSEVRTEERAES
ncbi:MAG: alpha/beta hydrolase [Spirochaetota bacterium]